MIAIGSDHGGVELKDYLVDWLRSRGAGHPHREQSD
jgi:ribose 5-phosphate isomerase RpiB